MNYDQAVDYAVAHLEDPTLPAEVKQTFARLLGRIRKIDLYQNAEKAHIEAEKARISGSRATLNELMATIDDDMNSSTIRTERAVLILCAKQPIPVVAAAIHALTCEDEKLRRFLHGLDVVCRYHAKKEAG